MAPNDPEVLGCTQLRDDLVSALFVDEKAYSSHQHSGSLMNAWVCCRRIRAHNASFARPFADDAGSALNGPSQKTTLGAT